MFSRAKCLCGYQVHTPKKVSFLNPLSLVAPDDCDLVVGPWFQDPDINEWLCCWHMTLRGTHGRHRGWPQLLVWHGQSHDYDTVCSKRSRQHYFHLIRGFWAESQNHMATVRGSVRTFLGCPLFSSNRPGGTLTSWGKLFGYSIHTQSPQNIIDPSGWEEKVFINSTAIWSSPPRALKKKTNQENRAVPGDKCQTQGLHFLWVCPSRGSCSV